MTKSGLLTLEVAQCRSALQTSLSRPVSIQQRRGRFTLTLPAYTGLQYLVPFDALLMTAVISTQTYPRPTQLLCYFAAV